MFKKMTIGFICLTVLTVAGCGTQKKKAEDNKTKQEVVKKSDQVQVSLNGATYVKPYEGSDGERDKDLLAIELKVKNIGKEQAFISPDWFGLTAKGDDEKISAEDIYSNRGLKTLESGKLSADSAKTGYIVFPVDPDKKYTLTVSPTTFDDSKAKEIKISIDPSKYNDTKDIAKEAEKALAAYVDTVFLDKDNKDKALLSEGTIKAGQEKLETEFKKFYKDLSYYNKDLSDERVKQAFTDYRNEQKDKFKYKAKLKGYLPTSTAFKVSTEGISEEVLNDKIDDEVEKENDKTDDYDSEKSAKIVMDRFKDILKDTKAEKVGRDEFELIMVKKDNKWSIDLGSEKYYGNKSLLENFLGSRY